MGVDIHTQPEHPQVSAPLHKIMPDHVYCISHVTVVILLLFSDNSEGGYLYMFSTDRIFIVVLFLRQDFAIKIAQAGFIFLLLQPLEIWVYRCVLTCLIWVSSFCFSLF